MSCIEVDSTSLFRYKEIIKPEGWENRMIYPDELREEILEKAISSKKTPMVQLAKEYGISRGTLLSWRKEAGLLESSNEEPGNPSPGNKQGFSIKEKLCMIKETFHMNELELGEYCRSKGILASDLRRWEEEITEPVKDLTAAERVSLMSANRKLKKELDRKNKALAEAAALLVLSKKAEAIWWEKEEEK